MRCEVHTDQRLGVEVYHFQGMTVADFSDLARSCRTYEDFTEKIVRTDTSELTYLGLAICGPKRQINKLTGSLPLLK